MQLETIEQIKVIEWLKQCHPEIPYIHIPNQRICSVHYQLILKRMGVRKDIPDLLFPLFNKDFPCLWIEQKTLTGKATKGQKQMIKTIMSWGHEAKICYGADQSIKTLKNFYNLKDAFS